MKLKIINGKRYFLAIVMLFAVLYFPITTVHASPEIQINLPEYKLRLVDGGEVVKAYDIAIGKITSPTPTGNYEVTEKEENPTWYPTNNQRREGYTTTGPGPENPLGVRWIQFYGVYGIHGTMEEEKIGFGYAVSEGCIRMRNSDVEDLYGRITIGTPVTIIYQTILLEAKRDGIHVNLVPDVYNQGTNNEENYNTVIGNSPNPVVNRLSSFEVTNNTR